MTKRKAKLDYSTDLPRRSVPEVTMRMEAETSRQRNARDIRFFGPKVTGEALVNAILLHFFDLPEAERDRIVDLYVGKFEAMVSLRKEEPAERVAGEGGDEYRSFDLGEREASPPSGKKPKRRA